MGWVCNREHPGPDTAVDATAGVLDEYSVDESIDAFAHGGGIQFELNRRLCSETAQREGRGQDCVWYGFHGTFILPSLPDASKTVWPAG